MAEASPKFMEAMHEVIRVQDLRGINHPVVSSTALMPTVTRWNGPKQSQYY